METITDIMEEIPHIMVEIVKAVETLMVLLFGEDMLLMQQQGQLAQKDEDINQVVTEMAMKD